MKQNLILLWKSLNKRTLFMLGLVLTIWVVFNALSGGYILRPENLSNLFRQVTVVAILACAMTLVIVAGHIDLSVGSALGMFGALTAAFITQLHINPVVAVILILALGFSVGCLHGAMTYYLNMPAFVVTLGGLIAYRGITQYVARESIPLRTEWIKAIAQKSIPDWLGIALLAVIILSLAYGIWRKRSEHRNAGLTLDPLWIDITKLIFTSAMVALLAAVLLTGDGIPIELVMFVTIALIFSFVATHTRFGHYVYAIGGNKQAAFYSGISIAKNTVLTFGLMGLLGAVAGIVTIAELNAAAPDIGDLKELEAIGACVIGGASLSGGSGVIGMSVLGALIMASIKNGMSMLGIVAQMQKVILGTLLVVAVALDQWSRRSKKSG
jgi:D-xylose transport system permease protein